MKQKTKFKKNYHKRKLIATVLCASLVLSNSNAHTGIFSFFKKSAIVNFFNKRFVKKAIKPLCISAGLVTVVASAAIVIKKLFARKGKSRTQNTPNKIYIHNIKNIKIKKRKPIKTKNDLLLRACRSGNLKTVRNLMNDETVDINHKNQSGNTALHKVLKRMKNIAYCGYESREIVRVLVRNGADIYATNNKGDTPVELATKYDKAFNFNILPVLLDEKLDQLNHSLKHRQKPLDIQNAAYKDECCPICLDTVHAHKKKSVVISPCGHVIHNGRCLKGLFGAQGHRCPICRHGIEQIEYLKNVVDQTKKQSKIDGETHEINKETQ